MTAPVIVGRVTSVRAGRITRHDRPAWDEVRSPWRTAFWKDECPGPVRIGTLGLEGDEQADKRHHGGPERAVLMVAGEHYDTWRTLPGLADMGPGGLGENLTLAGLDECTVCIGDVLAVGEAELQVASPRGPCMDISRRWDTAWLLQQVVDRRWPGWYLRVRREGVVKRGDDVWLVERPHDGWTVDRLLRLRYTSPRDRAECLAAAALAALDDEWRERMGRLPAHD